MKTSYIGFFLLLSLLTSCTSDSYKIVDGKVYYHEWTFSFGPLDYLLEGADAATFEEMKGGYAHDAQHAWYHEYLLEGVKGNEFRYAKYEYAMDKHLVFHRRDIVYGADASTFQLHSEYYAEDAHDFYWDGHPIYVADKASFKLLGKKDSYDTSWGIDRQYVYYLSTKSDSIASVAPKRMPIGDYDSFEPAPEKPADKEAIILGCYARDKYCVYYEDTIVVDADPATFVEIDWEIGQDKAYRYKKGKRE